MSPLNCWCFYVLGENHPIDWFSTRDQPFTVKCRLPQLRLWYYRCLPRIYDNNRYSPSRSGIQVRDEIDRGIPIIVQSRAPIPLPISSFICIPKYGCCWKYNGHGIGENFSLSEFPIRLLVLFIRLLFKFNCARFQEMTTHLVLMSL